MVLKILSFHPLPPEEPKGFSGGIRRFFEIGKRWTTLGNVLYLIACGEVNNLNEIFQSGFHTIEYNFHSVKGLGHVIHARRMLKKVPKEKFDFIYCPGEEYPMLLVSTLAKKRFGIPLVVCVNLFSKHDRGFFSSLKTEFSVTRNLIGIFRSFYWSIISGWTTFIRNLFLKKADLIFAVSNDIKELLTKIGLERNRIFIVSGGADYAEIRSVTCKQKKYHACFLGRITSTKGILDLVELWRNVVETKPESRLIIIGDGTASEVKRVKNLIQNYSLEKNIFMPGFIIGKDKYRLLKESEIFIFPSYAEGFAGAICEAMACGLPVIAYDLPSYKEWYGDDIVYVKRWELNDLLQKTLYLLRNREIREKLGQKGEERAKKYTWDSVSEYELKIINETIIKDEFQAN